ncbi:unnamed protein product, partial [Didymodactylos carnosus]
MFFPANLPYIVLLRTLHEKESDLTEKWFKLSRFRFFILITVFQMIYYWLPGYIMPILTAFSWMCMINPENILLSQLTGYSGFSFGALQFDWWTLTSPWLSPIVVPRWAQINIFTGFVLFAWIIMPSLYYSNVFKFKIFPIFDSEFFTLNSMSDQITLIDASDLSGLSSVTNIVGTYLLFASYAALFIHTLLYHGNDIRKHFKMSLRQRPNDVHCRLMSKYAHFPDWWYTILFICTFVVAVVTCHRGNFMPWYYLILALCISFICLLPVGIVFARTSLILQNSVIVNIIGGMLFHAYPLDNITFSIFSSGTLQQALILLFNFKFCHYMKISPLATFTTQLGIAILAVIIKQSMSYHLLNTVDGICISNPDWACPNLIVEPAFFAAR